MLIQISLTGQSRNYNFRGLQLSRLSRLGIIYSILVNCVYDFALILCEERSTNQCCIVKTETKLIIPQNDQVKTTSKGANRSLQVSNISSSNFVLFRWECDSNSFLTVSFGKYPFVLDWLTKEIPTSFPVSERPWERGWGNPCSGTIIKCWILNNLYSVVFPIFLC